MRMTVTVDDVEYALTLGEQSSSDESIFAEGTDPDADMLDVVADALALCGQSDAVG